MIQDHGVIIRKVREDPVIMRLGSCDRVAKYSDFQNFGLVFLHAHRS